METQKELIENLIEWSLEKKAEDIKHYDIHEESNYTDFVLICHGNGPLHVQAIAQNIIEKCKENKIRIYSTEGLSNAKWVLIDLIDIVIHVFDEETRNHYRLEDLLEINPKRN
ncbi:MAG: ribosome silencing factor [Candidatus Cloacimonetes bacterium]|nr:ribosome silencing factor [Candidatus Cloacimonadota bacterium]